MLIKQIISYDSAGKIYAIGGNPDEIRDKFYSMINFGGIEINPICLKKPFDLGNPESFQFLVVGKKAYIKARRKNLSLSINNVLNNEQFKGKKGGNWLKATKFAIKELKQIKNETFLRDKQEIDIEAFDFEG